MALCLTACDAPTRIGKGPEDRINEAYPLSPPAEGAKAALLSTIGGAESERARFQAELASKLKLRALTCGKGLQPSMFTSVTDIRKDIGDPTCFAQQDAALAQWLGMRRVSLVLRQPPLRPIPSSPAPFLIARENLSTVRTARAAGVALVDSLQYIHVFDLASSAPIYTEQKTGSSVVPASLSPNGRLFFLGDGGKIKIKESETGAILFEQTGTSAWSAAWLDDRTVLIGYGTPSGKPILLDLESGQEVPIPGSQDAFTSAVAIPTPEGAPSRFALLGFRTICVIELVRNGRVLEPRLLEERPNGGGSVSSNTSGLTADAKRFFFSNRALTIVTLEPFNIETISFEPLLLQGAVALPDPDKLLLKGYTMATATGPQRMYVFSLQSRTLAEVDKARLLSDRLVYLAPLNRLGLIAGAKVALLEGELPTGTAAAVGDVQAELIEEGNQRKLAEFQRRMEQAGSAQMQYPAMSGIQPIPGPMAELGRDAIVEAIGVYQGSGSATRPGEARRVGVVDVRVRRSSRPLILVLSSYEPVRWNLISEGGARLAAVLIASYHPATVVGAGNARQLQIGQMHSYNRSSREFARLDQEVARQTGQRIAVFQGRYEGASFAVGGS